MQTRPMRNKRPCKANYNVTKRWEKNKARRKASPQDSGVATFAECVAIQQRRVKAGKRGIAKAVRRFTRRAAIRAADVGDGKSFAIPDYLSMIAKLPVTWKLPKKDVEQPTRTLQDQIRESMGVEL